MWVKDIHWFSGLSPMCEGRRSGIGIGSGIGAR